MDLESTRTAGSKAAEVIYTASAADVLTVVVGGRVIVSLLSKNLSIQEST